MRGKPGATRLIIYTSTTLYREALQSLLSIQSQIELIGAVGGLSEVESFIGTEQPTAVLVDTRNSYAEIARQLCAILSNSGLLFLVDEYDLELVLLLLKAGAMGCVSRNASLDELARAIIAAGRGEVVLPPAIANQALVTLASGKQVTQDNLAYEDLTEREIEVIALLAQGMTNKDIAQSLFISVRTVEAHLRNIYSKLEVHSRTEAALWAVANDFITE